MPEKTSREFIILARRKLAAAPPPTFDCRREGQNRFLYDWAWADQRQRLTTTYLYHAAGAIAAYAAVCMDALVLGTREKPEALRYKHIGALKLAQLGVDGTFQGQGLGAMVVADVTALASDLGQRVSCRYLTLDAKPDLVEWYRSLGFEVNQLKQKQRIAAAAARNPDEIPVSMRFDLREV